MLKTKKYILAAFVVFSFIFSVVPSKAIAQEAIKNFDVSVQILEDGTLRVKEDITAKVENININRGIVRAFPVEYEDKDGETVYVTFDVIDVKLDGVSTNWKENREGRYATLIIGNPNRKLSYGLHKFTIEYETKGQLGFFEDYDELYWNVTGNQWTFPILNASFKVALPNQNFGEGFNSAEWYVGKYGEKGTKSDAKVTENKTISLARPLDVAEGLTVVYTWNKGIIAPPPPPEEDNETAHGMIAFLVFLATLFWYLFSWNKWGRDIKRKAIIPLYYPPKESSPAFMKYAQELKVDKNSLSANILDLAVRGYIRIEEQKEKGFLKDSVTYILHKEKDDYDKLPKELELIMSHFFDDGADSLNITEGNSEKMYDAMAGLEAIMEMKEEELYSLNTDKFYIGIILYIIGVVALLPFSGDGLSNLLTCGFLGFITIIGTIKPGTKKEIGKVRMSLQFLLRIAFPLIYALVMQPITSDGGISWTIIFFALSSAAIFVFRPLMHARTEYGYEKLNETDGLIMYMNAAEKDRLEMLNPPEETPQLYEKLMPYALALGVAKTWGNRFEKVLSATDYHPTWYSGTNPYLFMYGGGLNNFYSAISSNIVRNMPSQTTTDAPGSFSGFGGGGFSGGGGGGGGGSGW